MIREAINRIIELAPPTLFKFEKDEDDEKRLYASDRLTAIKDPSPGSLDIHTLQGLCDWIDADRGQVEMSEIIIAVEDYNRVRIYSVLQAKWAQRHHYITATPAPRDEFEFGRFMPIESFIIRVQCGFVDGPNKKKVIQAVSSVQGSLVKRADDDGVAQKVTVENEVTRRPEETTLDPMVALQPFRTFTEVTQPESLFLLRLKSRPDSLPEVALFPADGGAWKNVAILAIADFLRENKTVKSAGCSVIA
jgi:hypothetical protein